MQVKEKCEEILLKARYPHNIKLPVRKIGVKSILHHNATITDGQPPNHE